MIRLTYKSSIKMTLALLFLFVISCGSETTFVDLTMCNVIDSITGDTIQVPTFDYTCP